MTGNGLWLAHGEPAGGAATKDLIPAAIVAGILIAALVVFGIAHRRGRTQLLTRLGDFSERLSGLPRWASLPMGITGVSLLVAVFGFYWDVATHIDNGRDAGPFANPSHFLIIFGLAGIALAGVVSILLGSEQSSSSVRIRDGWHAPVGGVLLLVCGGIAVLGFPLDDVWHRLFGQDVTLWSPTHMQMVGGAALSTLALLILQTEGQRAAVDQERATKTFKLASPATAGAFLVGLSAFQAEFDYSVPQFRLLYHPILLMLSAGAALVAARIKLGPGGALKAVTFYLGLRVLLTLVVGPLMGHTTLHFPLYLVEALAIEAVAALFGTERRLAFGFLSGIAVGAVGLPAEWAWSHVWMTMEWPAALLPEGVILGFIAAVAGGCLGAIIGRGLLVERDGRDAIPKWSVLGTGVAVLFVLAYPFPSNAAVEGTIDVTLEPADRSPGRWVTPTITFEDPELARDAEWLKITSWQGGGSVVEELVPQGDGTYTTPVPVPVYGEWKTLLRLHRGDSLVAVPFYLPRDPAIPAPEVPAQQSFRRDFISDKEIVLREAKDVSSSLTITASSVLAVLVAGWILALGWGLSRVARRGRGRAPASAVTSPA